MQYRFSAIRPIQNIHLLRALALVACISSIDREVLWAQEPPRNEELLQAERIFDPAHIVEISVELKDEDWRNCVASRESSFILSAQHRPPSLLVTSRRMSRLTEEQLATSVFARRVSSGHSIVPVRR